MQHVLDAPHDRSIVSANCVKGAALAPPTGNELTCSSKAAWVGEWNLGAVDRFEPCNYEGVPGRRNLVVHNENWLGLIRRLSLQRIYDRGIHNYRHGRNW